jgi:hypothetical protein
MSDRLLISTRKGLFEARKNGGGWEIARRSFLGSPVTLTLADPRDGALYAALDLGHFGVKLHRSDDGGETWEEIAAPSYEGVGDGEDAPSLKLIWALEPGGADEPGVLWAGTIPGGLFKSEDRGASWALNKPLWEAPEREFWFGGGADQPGIHSISVDPRNSKVITLAVSCGGIWQSEDGGSTWNLGGKGLWAAYVPPGEEQDLRSQDVHMISRCTAAPDTIWVQHHNAAFKTDVGYKEVEEIKPEPSVFGFAVAAHPKDPKTAWFVPGVKDEFRYPVDGKLVVARTMDGGKSFEQLSNGLPDVEAYDLVYRHGLDVDETGDRLAFGSTTGGVWITENGGDEWSELPARLPPVYAVRWG